MHVPVAHLSAHIASSNRRLSLSLRIIRPVRPELHHMHSTLSIILAPRPSSKWISSLLLLVGSAWSIPPPLPSPPSAPSFSSVGSLTRPASTLPTEPVLEGDTGSIRIPVNNTDGRDAGDHSSSGGVNSAGGRAQSAAVATHDEWAGIKKLFKAGMPFLVLIFVVCCACGGCCCCYYVYRRATRRQAQAACFGPGQFIFPDGSIGAVGPYPPCHTDVPMPYSQRNFPSWCHKDGPECRL